MSQIIQFESDFGPILIEIEDQFQGGLRDVSRSNEPEKTGRKFSEALDTIKAVANTLVEKTAELVRGPDEFVVELGLTFKAETGVIVAKAATEGNLKVSMKWVKPAAETPA